MNRVYPLEQVLTKHLPFHLTRVKFIACFLIAIIDVTHILNSKHAVSSAPH
jgi:hypothetical protein